MAIDQKATVKRRRSARDATTGRCRHSAPHRIGRGGAGARRRRTSSACSVVVVPHCSPDLDQLACVVAPLAGPGPASDFRCRIMVPECAVAAWHLAPMHADPGSLSALPIRACPSMRFAGRERKLRSAWTSTTHPMTMTRRRCLAPAALIP